MNAGADINKKIKLDGQMVLMIAVQEGDADMVRFFFSTAALFAEKDDESRTAMTFARRGGQKEIIELLQNLSD